MIRKKRYNKIALIILKSLAVGSAVVVVITLPGIAPVLSLFTPKDARHRYRIKKTANDLEKNGLIKTRLNKGQLEAQLTQKGSFESRMLFLQEQGLPTNKRWDGKWRIVFFDIPEERKQARRALTNILKEIGMYPLQKSTFIYPYECGREIDFVTSYFNVTKYVQFAVAEKIDSSLRLCRFFNV